MKTLLIPTDFNLQSLNCVPGLVNRFYPEEVTVILVHMMKITDNLSELLMLSRRSAEYQHISNEFYAACTRLKQQHHINVKIEFFYGSTVSVFKNFLEANQVDSIVVLEDYPYQLLNKNSIESSLLVNRSGLNLIHTHCNKPARPEVALTTQKLEEANV